ncbi:uncharacterized protein LOC125068313 [Vanessa atalanta]|uniref:uncharacterized protein LOC125068313 n=1 Tax=Vanessa atalanta TaxID=42275 RepID=UPI001FCCD181|nr:uncharacterized protein LOC125068313 [Vanessa atalanta]
MLVNFLEAQGLFLMNSFFEKKPQRKWTWRSPNNVTRNEIDFIISNKRHIFRDVSVINRFNTGSDHRLVRGTLDIDFKAERSRMMRSTLRPTMLQTAQGSEKFQMELQNQFTALETVSSIDEKTDTLVKILQNTSRKCFPPQKRDSAPKLSAETLELMRKRRELPSFLSDKALNRTIKTLTRRDLRCSNTRAIKAAIEQNRGSKVFARKFGRPRLTKLKTENGKVVTSRPEIVGEVERFYGQLFSSRSDKPVGISIDDQRAPLTRHYSEELPVVDQGEIRAALEQLKNNKAPGDDGITTELLKAGGTPLFSRVVTHRLARRLDEFQPPEQAGFRSGYSTVDHIHIVRQIVQKTEEYNQPLCMAFVDYEKAFDSIETWAVLDSLQRCHIDWRYIEVLRCLYNAATMTVHIQDCKTKAIQLRRGVRQGDVISPKLFTNALEDVFKTLDWTGYGVNVNGECISHLRFADDIVIIAESLEQLTEMLRSLSDSSRRVGLGMNLDKTKVMFNRCLVGDY